MKQLHGVMDIKSAEIQPVNLSFAAIKVLSAKWLVQVNEYLAKNPQFIVNGFRKAGISPSLDGSSEDKDMDEDDNSEDDKDEDAEDNEDSEDHCMY